jgi:hypothetical protein
VVVGVNLAPVSDWGPAWEFVDGFKQAREWIPQNIEGDPWVTGADLSRTPTGHIASLDVGQVAATLLFRELEGHYPAGEYVCLYEGQGTIEIDGFDGKTIRREPGRMVVDVTPGDGGILVRVTATDPADPVRNIRFVMPGYEETYAEQIWHPAFLKSLDHFSVVRFMNWQRTTNSPLVHWRDRATTEHFSQASAKGAALEYSVGLSNRLSADPWFCMPHQCDDEFVRAFATMVKEQIEPSRTIYIEYSNEVWNNSFPQAHYAEEQGMALGLSDDPFEARLRFYAQRSVEIFAIWEDVFGSTERLVRVIATQYASPWAAKTTVDWQEAYAHADALAVAPYFGGSLGLPANAEETAAMSVEDVLATLAEDIEAQQSRTADHKALAQARGLDLIAYEGGQHLVAVGDARKDASLTATFIAANRHSQMRELYRTYLENWQARGGGLMVLYSHLTQYADYGSWGLSEWQDQDVATAHKLQGVLDYTSEGRR